ncbi:unnamed protein product [Lymnaea stagnalis]|uniref:G-protein coupled receptors family 1 profile domain-containing protein n=1 Tax=Lymnaea stagnalis TaxID=6523 RepID=A0AAV2H2H8_LYMST
MTVPGYTHALYNTSTLGNMSDVYVVETDDASMNTSVVFDDFTFENPFHQPWVKFMFILLFSLVFLVCCIGNSVVLYTIARNKRMRTRTNFFLANLAVADLSVGVLCILPKLVQYLSPSWFLGEAMCKINYFVQSMTYTASILLLTAIAIERYIAVLHPLRSKCLVTQTRLIIAQILIWVSSAAYSVPDLHMFSVVDVQINNVTTSFCFPTDPYTNMKNYYTTNFVLWYILPLCIMCFMYTRVCCTLWKTSKLTRNTSQGGLMLRPLSSRDNTTARQQETVLCYDGSITAVHARRASPMVVGANDSVRAGKPPENNNGKAFTSLICINGGGRCKEKEDHAVILQNGATARESFNSRQEQRSPVGAPHRTRHPQTKVVLRSRRYLSCDFTSESDATSSEEYDMVPHTGLSSVRRAKCPYRMSSHRVLSSRRRVIRLLVVVLLTFAVCVLPTHLKLLLMFWGVYPTTETKHDILSPLSFVLLYINSALNPILYWVFSDAFRRSFKDNCRRTCLFRSHSRHS